MFSEMDASWAIYSTVNEVGIQRAAVSSGSGDQIVNQAKRQLDQIPTAMLPIVHAAGMLAGARVALRKARRLVPIRRGRLRKSTRLVVSASHQGVYFDETGLPIIHLVTGGRGARHAHLIEFGTVKSAARPYLLPAVESTLSQQFEAMHRTAFRTFERTLKQLQSGTISNRNLSQLTIGIVQTANR